MPLAGLAVNLMDSACRCPQLHSTAFINLKAMHSPEARCGPTRECKACHRTPHVMPLPGWALGLAFASMIRNIDHWIAFVSCSPRSADAWCTPAWGSGVDDDGSIPLITGWALASVAIATSIDAAAAGVTIAFLRQPVLVTCAVIGTVTLFSQAQECYLARSSANAPNCWVGSCSSASAATSWSSTSS